MTMRQKLPVALLVLVLSVSGVGPLSGHAQTPDTSDTTRALPQPEIQLPAPLFVDTPRPSDTVDSDVPYVPTPKKVVNRMLELADVDENDVLYDLGSGDGRIVIQAAKQFGARGVGIEIDPNLVKEARQNAREAGVTDLVEFRRGDIFKIDISEATAVTMYLLPSVNLDLRPKLFEELASGTPVVSHDFDMGKWTPERTIEMDGHTLYRWTIPETVPDHLRMPEERSGDAAGPGEDSR